MWVFMCFFFRFLDNVAPPAPDRWQPGDETGATLEQEDTTAFYSGKKKQHTMRCKTVTDRQKFVRVGFWQNGFFVRIFIFEPPDFFADFLSPDFLFSFLWEKGAQKNPPGKSRQNPPKFIQQKSPTHFCRGAGPKNDFRTIDAPAVTDLKYL